MKKGTEYDQCGCGHSRKYHGKSKSINYTEGKCRLCKCENFVITNLSNFSKAIAIVKQYIYIKPKDDQKLKDALFEIDQLYQPTEESTYAEKNGICKNIINILRDFTNDEELIAEIETDLTWLSEFDRIRSMDKPTNKLSAEDIVDKVGRITLYYGREYGDGFKEGVEWVLDELKNQQP